MCPEFKHKHHIALRIIEEKRDIIMQQQNKSIDRQREKWLAEVIDSPSNPVNILSKPFILTDR